MGRSVLLVDDSESSRVVLALLLEDEGFQVEVAGSFKEAKATLSRGGAWDLVVLDQQLGDGRGSDLLPLLRERAPGARAVLVSGSTEDPALSRAGFDAVIGKATPFPEMLAQVTRLLG